MKFVSFLLLFSCLNFNRGFTQNSTPVNVESTKTLTEFENRLQFMIQKVAPASVLVITHEYLAGHKGMLASGVSVTEEGTILTAGHMVIPGGKYEIVFPDGRKVPAKGLGKIGRLDAGILKITEEGQYPFAEMGSTQSVIIGEPCFSLSYPGSFPGKMVLRFGQVLKLDATGFGSMQTTCLMEPGDSGGPVFDMDGKVIGIRSYIGMPLDENYEVPVDFYRSYWSALQQQSDYRHLPLRDSVFFPAASLKKETLWPQLENAIVQHANKLKKYAVSVESDFPDSVQTITGALLNLEGFTKNRKFLNSTYVISKNSEVGKSPRVFVNGRRVAASVVFTERSRDLVLLRLDEKLPDALKLKDICIDSINRNSPGKILLTPLPAQEVKISVLGTSLFHLPGIHNTGFLGVRLEAREGKNIITTVQPNSAAKKGGLQIGDEIISLNKIIIHMPNDFINELKNLQPREEVTIVRVQQGNQDTVKITLQSRPYEGIDHISEKFTDGRSEIRDGFENIFIHDAKLKPFECGGPLFDINQNFMGINMARYSRTSSLAMPAGEIVKFLQEAIGTGWK